MIGQKHIRNFAIIAHIDHGKSTLSDRLLEITHTIAKEKLQEQFLDQNPISRERGITIKLAPVRMQYEHAGETYELNLIDTPGHVDFSYEVSRTLAACEGAVLLVDATQGIQAQTVAHFHAAKKEGLVMIPVLNKIDLPAAQTDAVMTELVEVFGFHKSEILLVSAKTGMGVPELLEKIVEKFPPPEGDAEKPLRGLIFDAAYDEYRGVVAYVRIIDGAIRKGQQLTFFQTDITTEVTDVGSFSPYLKSEEELATGEIGYVISGVKNLRDARVGDTIMLQGQKVEPLPGYTIPKPMVYFGIYPKSTDDLRNLRESLGKLTLNDTALTYTEEHSSYLGSGFRVGFLGLLHAEIVKQRLEQEFGLDLLMTMPQIQYRETADGRYEEPLMLLTIYAPKDYAGQIMSLCQKRKGELVGIEYHETYATLMYQIPFTMFIRGLSAELKSVSSGYASIDYELSDYVVTDFAKLEIKINDVAIDVLSELVYRDEALGIARVKAGKLKESLPRQQFRQVIQGVVNGAIIAREEVAPYRKDVLQKLYGGDRTRKDKLLEAQKKGKSRMITQGKVIIPQEALFSMIES
jgi:GTP-binding protein LepA